MEQGAHGGPSRRRLGFSSSGGMRRPRERWLARMTQLSSGGGCGVTDRYPHGPVAEVGDQVQASAERFDVAGDDLEGCNLAVLDLGDAGHAHPERRGQVFLRQAELLAVSAS